MNPTISPWSVTHWVTSLPPSHSSLPPNPKHNCVKSNAIDQIRVSNFRFWNCRTKMGGGGADHGNGGANGGDFRYKVWSMTGGPHCRPKHWKRNTAIAMFGIVLVCIPIFKLSAKLEVLHSLFLNLIPVFFTRFPCFDFISQNYYEYF